MLSRPSASACDPFTALPCGKKVDGMRLYAYYLTAARFDFFCDALAGSEA